MKFSSARLGQLIALSGAVLIASMTLVPHPELTKESARTPLSCLLCGDYGIVDVFLNILLFIPFGFGLRLAGVSRFRGQALLMATSLGIELLQMNVIMGRDASLSDFLTNSLGGGLGIWMADHWSDFVFPSPARARRLRIPAALGWLAVWVASAWLVEPSMPPTTWFGQLAAEDVLLDNFRGQLLTAKVNGRAIPSARLNAVDSAALHDSFVAGSAVVRATVVAGPATRFPAPIVSIFDLASSEILVLGQHRGDLIFRIRLGTADHELHLPEIRLPGALAIPGDTVLLGGGLREGRLFVQAWSKTFDRRREARLSPSWGWMFVLPWHYAMGPRRTMADDALGGRTPLPGRLLFRQGDSEQGRDSPGAGVPGRDCRPRPGRGATPGGAAGRPVERMVGGRGRGGGGLVGRAPEFRAPDHEGQSKLTPSLRTSWRPGRR